MIDHYSDDLKKALSKWAGYVKKHEKSPRNTFFKRKKEKWRDIFFELWRKERPDLKMIEAEKQKRA